MSLEDSANYLINEFPVHQLKQANTSADNFFSTLSVGDPEYRGAYGGYFSITAPLQGGSNPGTVNDQGTLQVPENFVGSTCDYKIYATGADKFYYGLYTNLEVGGPFSGTHSRIARNAGDCLGNGYGVDYFLQHDCISD